MVIRSLTTFALVLLPALASSQTAGNYTIAPTTTGSPAGGLIYDKESSWEPLTLRELGSYPFYQFFNFESLGLNCGGGCTTSDRWDTQVVLSGINATTDSGMANSHTLVHLDQVQIPPGLGDGQNGAPWSNGLPGNPYYQEAGIFEGSCQVLSPGHYCEGGAAYMYDNDHGTGAVPARLTGYTVQMSKYSSDNTYPTYAFDANSIGTHPPRAAFRVDGGWQRGIDLSGMAPGGIAMVLPQLPSNCYGSPVGALAAVPTQFGYTLIQCR